MTIRQLVHVCVNRHDLIYSLAHISDEVVYVREVLVFGVVLIIINHAHYCGGNDGTLAVGPDWFGMVILLYKKCYKVPHRSLCSIKITFIHIIDDYLKRIIVSRFLWGIEINYTNSVSQAFQVTVRVMI